MDLFRLLLPPSLALASHMFVMASGCSGSVTEIPEPSVPDRTEPTIPQALSDDRVLIDVEDPPGTPSASHFKGNAALPEAVEESPSSPDLDSDDTSHTLQIDVDAPFYERNKMEKRLEPARDRPPVDCAPVDRLVYYLRGSQGICGPVVRLSISADGNLVLERSQGEEEESGGCAQPMRGTKIIDAARASGLIRDACAEYNEAYSASPKVGCARESRRFYFFDDSTKLFDTMTLPCADGPMKESTARMATLLEEFE